MKKFTISSTILLTLLMQTGWADNNNTWRLPKKQENVPFAKAQTACSEINVSGTTCKLPEITQLYSLLDNTPEGMTKSLYWSSQTSVDKTSEAFYVSFASSEVASLPKNEKLYFICACTKPEPAKNDRFSKKGSLVYDSKTKLTWETKTSAQAKRARFNQKAAMEYCKNLAIEGQKGFTLPTASQLLGIINFDKKEPAIYEPFATDTQQRYYWSKSSGEEFSNTALAVGFRFGSIAQSQLSNESFVRCVKE